MPELRIASTNRGTTAVPLPRYRPLVIVLAAVSAGIVVDRMWPISADVWWGASVAAWCTWLAVWLFHGDKCSSAALCVCAAALGGAWHHSWWYLYRADEVTAMIGPEPQAVVVEAIASYAPRHIPAPPPDPLRAVQIGERSRFEVKLKALRSSSSWRPVSGKALVLVEGRLEGVLAGDRLQIACDIRAPAPPANPGDADFRSYARADRRTAFLNVSFPESVSVIQRGSSWHWRRGLDALRQSGARLLWQHIAPQRAGLAAALLLGAREQLFEEHTAAFVRTNTIHILAISGMHVAILAAWLFYLLRVGVMSRRTTLAAVALGTILYTLLTDAPPSAVRAMILVLLVCLALFVGRPSAPFSCWAAGGLVVLALNPSDLFRAGTQLSFLAVFAMSWLAPQWTAWQRLDPLERLILDTRPKPLRTLRRLKSAMVEAMVVTTVVWLVTAPLIASRFHVLSPGGLVLTVFLMPSVSLALMSGFATMLLGGFVPPAGALFGAICDFSLWTIERCVMGAGQAPVSHFWLPGPQEWWMAGFYLGLALFVTVPRVAWAHYVQLAGLWTCVGLVLQSGATRERCFKCTFLSVGHGTSVVIRTPEGQTILYDAGRLGSPAGVARSIGGALWADGIMRLDAVIISHADIDHYNALPTLLEQFNVETIYVSPLMFREEVEPLQILREAIESSSATLRELSVGDRLQFGESTIVTVLHPPVDGVAGTDNAQSMVLAIECYGRRLLLPGDLESPGTQALLSQPEWDCDVLLAPHHGSLRSNPPGFSSWCRPEWVVISGGYASDRAGSVRAAYEGTNCRVFHTAYDGAVRFLMTADGICAARWHENDWEPCSSR